MYLPRVYLGWYIPGYASLLYLGGVYTRVCLPTIPPWVHNAIHRPAHYWVHCSTAGTVREEEALGSEGRNPLGGRPLSLSGPSRVLRLVGRLCAELLLFSCTLMLKDWIDEGSLSLYILRLGTCCAEWSHLPAIRSCWESCGEESSSLLPVEGKCQLCPSHGPWPPVSVRNVKVDHEAISAPLPASRT